jgi:uncharacterized membrane protein
MRGAGDQDHPATAPAPPELFRPDRLLALSDGVFGVAITLLVIDLHLPPLPAGGDDTVLLQALLAMGPKLLLFAFTFLVVGMSWLGHHRKFSYIHQVDGRLLWINLLYLMALCLVPFASSVLGEHGSRFAFVLYAAVMTLVEMLSAGMSAYGLREPFLAGPDLRPGLRQDMVLSPLLTGAIFAIAAGMAFGNLARIAHWTLLTVVPVMAFFGSRTRKPA